MSKVISKQNPQLKKKVLSDGRESLYLEYYLGRVSIPVLDEYGEPVFYGSSDKCIGNRIGNQQINA